MASTRVQVESPVLRTISDFKAKMTGGGASPNLFEVVLQLSQEAFYFVLFSVVTPMEAQILAGSLHFWTDMVYRCLVF